MSEQDPQFFSPTDPTPPAGVQYPSRRERKAAEEQQAQRTPVAEQPTASELTQTYPSPEEPAVTNDMYARLLPITPAVVQTRRGSKSEKTPGIFARNKGRIAAGAVVTLAVVGGTVGYKATHGEAPESEPYVRGAVLTPEPGQVDLLKGGTWSYMPGTKVESDGLAIHHTGRQVLEESDRGPGRVPEKPVYDQDPPVNLYGTHLDAGEAGNVKIGVRVEDIEGSATVSVLNKPPRKYDERVEHAEGISVTVQGEKAIVKAYDGTGIEPVETEDIILPGRSGQATEADIIIEDVNGFVEVTVNGSTEKIAEAKLGREAWFGFDTPKSFKVSGIIAQPRGESDLKAVDVSKMYDGVEASPNGLASVVAANGHEDKVIGTAYQVEQIAANPMLTKSVIQNVNAIKPEFSGKLQSMFPNGIENPEFGEMDAMMDFATKHNMKVHGHAADFLEAMPQWLTEKLQDPNTTKADAEELLTQIVTAYVSRYDGKHGHGKMDSLDVVNEPFDPDDYAALNMDGSFAAKLGKRHIAIALKAAHAANPDLKLYLNEWGVDTDDDRREATLDLALELIRQGIPLYGIGIQGHFFTEDLDDDDIMDTFYSDERGTRISDKLKEITDAGTHIEYSELSVEKNDDPATKGYIFGKAVQLMLQNDKADGLYVWGLANSSFDYRYMTATMADGDPGNDAPLIQKRNGKVTSEYYTVDRNGKAVKTSAWDQMLRAARGEPLDS